MRRYSGIAGKRVLVTGATSGLGLAMAEALLKEGARVVLSGRDPTKVERAVASVQALPGECAGVHCNVREEQSVRNAVAKAAQLWGGIDVLINNAGIGMRSVNPDFLMDPKPFWEVPAAGFRDLVDTNLTGYFLVAKEAVPYFLQAGSGRIINIGVTDHTMGAKGFIPYGPSRAATDSLSHIMAKDLADFGVTVNVLMPGGGTATGMIPDEILENRERFETKTGFTLLSPDVMAEPTLFLCSDQGEAVRDERISAKDFVQWYAQWLERNSAFTDAGGAVRP